MPHILCRYPVHFQTKNKFNHHGKLALTHVLFTHVHFTASLINQVLGLMRHFVLLLLILQGSSPLHSGLINSASLLLAERLLYTQLLPHIWNLQPQSISTLKFKQRCITIKFLLRSMPDRHLHGLLSRINFALRYIYL